MIAQPKYRSRVVIVDPHPEDYSALLARNLPSDVELSDVELSFAESGGEALRLRNEASPKLCVINFNLPDISGLDVYEMLVRKWSSVPFYIVGNDYSVEAEIATRRSGATFYFCKPLEWDWLASALGEPAGAA